MSSCRFKPDNQVTIDNETFLISCSIFRLKKEETYRDPAAYIDGLTRMIDYVNSPDMWYKNTLLRIYYDSTMRGVVAFDALKSKHGTADSKVQFVEYDCPGFKQDDVHYGLFGTMVRMMPLFQGDRYKLLFIADVDYNYGQIDMHLNGIPKRAMRSNLKWLFLQWIGYEYKYGLHHFNNYLDGTAVANFYSKEHNLPVRIMDGFLKEIVDPGSRASKILAMMRRESRERKEEAVEQVKYSEGLFSYGVDELFLNRYLINEIRGKETIGQLHFGDKLMNYPVEMIDLEGSSLASVNGLLNGVFNGKLVQKGENPIDTLNLGLVMWRNLLDVNRLRGSFKRLDSGEIIPNQGYLQLITMIDEFKKGVKQLHKRKRVKITDYRWMINLEKHDPLHFFNLFGILRKINAKEDLDKWLFYQFFLDRVELKPLKTAALNFETYLFQRPNGDGCYYQNPKTRQLSLVISRGHAPAQRRIRELLKQTKGLQSLFVVPLIRKTVGKRTSAVPSIESHYRPYDPKYLIKEPCPYTQDPQEHMVVSLKPDWKKYEIVADLLLRGLPDDKTAKLWSGLRRLLEETEKALGDKGHLYPRHLFPTDVLCEKADPGKCKWLFFDASPVKSRGPEGDLELAAEIIVRPGKGPVVKSEVTEVTPSELPDVPVTDWESLEKTTVDTLTQSSLLVTEFTNEELKSTERDRVIRHLRNAGFDVSPDSLDSLIKQAVVSRERIARSLRDQFGKKASRMDRSELMEIAGSQLRRDHGMSPNAVREILDLAFPVPAKRPKREEREEREERGRRREGEGERTEGERGREGEMRATEADLVNRIAELGRENLILMLDFTKKGDVKREQTIKKMRSILTDELVPLQSDRKRIIQTAIRILEGRGE